jgi:hypothetical protein
MLSALINTLIVIYAFFIGMNYSSLTSGNFITKFITANKMLIEKIRGIE